MSDRKNEHRSLHAITVSGRAALAQARTEEDRQRLRDRVHDLLAALEDQVIRDGADPALLQEIEHERAKVWP